MGEKKIGGCDATYIYPEPKPKIPRVKGGNVGLGRIDFPPLARRERMNT